MLIKLLIVPLYLILPFTMYWFESSSFWFIPFVLWLVGIIANALVERSREQSS